MPRAPKTMTANTLGESGMSIPPAFTSTRKRTRSNCARAINPKTIDATSDAGFFIFSAPRCSCGERGPQTTDEGATVHPLGLRLAGVVAARAALGEEKTGGVV